MSSLAKLKIDVRIAHGVSDDGFLPGAGCAEWFKDHPDAPEMVVVPAGHFLMGSPADESGRTDREDPRHEVTISEPFAVSRFVVTVAEFAAWPGGQDFMPNADPKLPATGMNWHQAKAYTVWLTKLTGRQYRLLSEAEWEHVARAGSTTPFWWGSWITSHQANYDGTKQYANRGLMWPFRGHVVPVDGFKPNPWGLYQVHGNVYEWCEDVPSSYEHTPTDGSACRDGDLQVRIYRGGGYGSPPSHLRSACRGSFFVDYGLDCLGFRVACSLDPVAELQARVILRGTSRTI